ncbi:chemotaxis protein CheB, partial [Kouleothrix aurantiaca]
PAGRDQAQLARAGQMLIQRIKVLARVKVVTHLRGRRRTNPQSRREVIVPRPMPPEKIPAVGLPQPRPGPLPPFSLVLIGASTGGPRIVNQVISALPKDFAAAVLVVQHIAAGFSNGMAEWLSYSSLLPVRLAQEGHELLPNTVLIAPDQTDLLITPERKVHLSDNPLLLQRPSIDISMQAAAEIFGARAIGVLLTGMGRDGAYGMLTIKRAGGYTIAQDEATSTIFGMPRAAIHLGAACDVLPAHAIAARLIEVVGRQMRTSVALDARDSL